MLIFLFLKLNRFQSARTAQELIEKAKKANEKLPEESRFDSNCITPGTEFMERLQQAFKHFVKLKLSTDPAWSHCRIILSGHEVSVKESKNKKKMIFFFIQTIS